MVKKNHTGGALPAKLASPLQPNPAAHGDTNPAAI